MRKLLLPLILFFYQMFSVSAQRASRYEIGWAILHPMAALKVKSITKDCNAIADTGVIQQQLDRYPSGGKADAFRHVFYMAAYSQKIKSRKVRKLGIAHEKGNYRQFLNSKKEEGEIPDSLSSEMDLRNNELGILIGKSNKKTPLAELVSAVIGEIVRGNAVIMKRNKNGQLLTCPGDPIEPEKYLGKWNIPKCLVPSSYSYSD